MQSRFLWLKYSRFSLAFLVACYLFAPVSARAADYPTHPLDSLSREEIMATVEVLKSSGKTSDASRYATIVLREPPKTEVLAFKPGSAFRREAFAVVYERAATKPFCTESAEVASGTESPFHSRMIRLFSRLLGSR